MGFWDDLWKNLDNFTKPLQDSINSNGGMVNPSGGSSGSNIIGSTNGGSSRFGASPFTMAGGKKATNTLKEKRNSPQREASSTPWKSGDGGVQAKAPEPVQVATPGLSDQSVNNSALMEGYLREIQDRLANSRATAPTVQLNTAPIDSAKASSVKALEDALASVVANIGTARSNTKSAYGQAEKSTQGAYDTIVDSSRKEGKKTAQDAGDYVQDALSNAASVALSGTNQAMTDSDRLMAEAAKNLGGNTAVTKSVNAEADPANSTETIRNNISQNFQDTANNAAKQTGRDINASSRYADTIASDGANAIASLASELANRNNQYDRDLVDARNTNASNLANINSTYADKLMQAQLAQQQEQNQLNNSAWQTNVANDSNALQGMIDLIGSENKSRAEQEMLASQAALDNSNYQDKAKNNQLEILLKGLVSNTEKNTVSDQDILELLRQIQG